MVKMKRVAKPKLVGKSTLNVQNNSIGHIYYPIDNSVINLLFMKSRRTIYHISRGNKMYKSQPLTKNAILALQALGFTVKKDEKEVLVSICDLLGVRIHADIRKKKNEVCIKVYSQERSALTLTCNIKSHVDSITGLYGDIDAGTKLEDCS